jgi:hypothetical protein
VPNSGILHGLYRFEARNSYLSGSEQKFESQRLNGVTGASGKCITLLDIAFANLI